MHHFKILGTLAVAAAAMAFAANASADYVTTTTGGSAATPEIHAVSEEGHIGIENTIAGIFCSSTFEASVTGHGAGSPVKGTISDLTFTGCTTNWHVTTVKPGSFEVKWTNGHDGMLVSNEARIEATRFGIKCLYKTENTVIGSLTGGIPATIDIEGTLLIDTAASSMLCRGGAAETGWGGKYITTSPLFVVPS